MGTPYVGEIRMFAGNFAPNGWNFCDGSLLPISEYDTLFNLIGTTYGGDGQSTFGVPDLRGRVPVHMTGSQPIGVMGGVEQVTLTSSQIPTHTHPLVASTNQANAITGLNGILAAPPAVAPYFTSAPDSNLNAASCSNVGGNQPHDNMQPYLAINFIISLFGIFPTPN